MPVSTKDELARDMGISAESIGDYRDNYVLKLMQRGVLTDLDIGYFRAKGQLKAGDLGIEMSQEEKEYVSLGHQKLLPPELVRDMERAEGRGRANLEKKTIQLILGRFLPVTASAAFQEENEELKNQLFGVRDRIVRDYDKIIDQLKGEFRQRAYTVYDRLETKPQEHRDSWAARYSTQLISRIPSKAVIHDSFYWTVRYNFVPLPSSIQEEALRQEEIRKDMELLTYETDDRKRQIEAMNKTVLSQMRAQKEEAMKQAGSFLDDTIFKLRSVVLQTVQKAMETMKRNDGKLMGASVKSLEGMITQAKMLNFYNDTEVNRFVEQIEQQLAQSSNNPSKAPKIEKIMKEMEIAMGRSVRACERQATKNEEIARIIGKDVIKTARRVE